MQVEEERLQQIQQQLGASIRSICQFCSEICSDMLEHIRGSCTGLSAEMMEDRPTFIRIIDRGIVCKRCFIMLGWEEWEKHRKNKICQVKRQQNQRRRNGPNQSIHLSLPLPNRSEFRASEVLPPLLSEGNERIIRNSQADNIEDDIVNAQINFSLKECLEIVRAILTPLIRTWLAKHQVVDTHVILAFLTSAITDFGINFFQKKVTIPTWSSLKKIDQSVDWTAFLMKPENLFNNEYIEERLGSIASQKQVARTIRGLNKLGKVFKGMVKLREVPSVSRAIRARTFVRLKDLFDLLSKMIATGKKKVIHCALDLYIIVLSGQRFLSDQQTIEAGVKALLQNNQGKAREAFDLSFPMVIGKTQFRTQVCLNEQLILLLQEFSWPGFSVKTRRIFQRMNEWLGITGYTLKDSLLNAATHYSPSLELSQRIAGHSSIDNTKRYTRESSIGAHLQLASLINIPGLDSRFGDYSQESLTSFFDSLTVPRIRYGTFKQSHMANLFRRIYGEQYERQMNNDIQLQFTKIQISRSIALDERNEDLVESLEPRVERISQSQQGQDLQSQNQSQQQIQEQTDVVVYGRRYQYAQRKFKKQSFYKISRSDKSPSCQKCSQMIQDHSDSYICIYCFTHYHPSCSTLLCRCVTAFFWSVQNPTLMSQNIHLRKEYARISLPSKYMRQQQLESEQQMIALLAIRRFRYTRLPIISPGYEVKFINQYWRGAAEVTIKNYQQYILGKYMPPIQARPIHNLKQNVFGSQFGIFATQKISKNVFIGEYACDLMNGRHLLSCKKHDSIMLYSQQNSPDDLFLAPKDYCGYVPLINTSVQFNCKSLKCIVNGALRILIYTAKLISKDQQIVYEYGQNYLFDEENLCQDIVEKKGLESINKMDEVE